METQEKNQLKNIVIGICVGVSFTEIFCQLRPSWSLAIRIGFAGHANNLASPRHFCCQRYDKIKRGSQVATPGATRMIRSTVISIAINGTAATQTWPSVIHSGATPFMT